LNGFYNLEGKLACMLNIKISGNFALCVNDKVKKWEKQQDK